MFNSIQGKEFLFSSGAGGWGTYLTVHADGSFDGHYFDSEWGLTGDDYPNGSYYEQTFSGQFDQVEKVDANTYRMHLKTFNKETPRTYIEDGVQHIVADDVYGLNSDSDVFEVYLPGTKAGFLDEEFMSWCPDRKASSLNGYGIHNVKYHYGFFTTE